MPSCALAGKSECLKRRMCLQAQPTDSPNIIVMTMMIISVTMMIISVTMMIISATMMMIIGVTLALIVNMVMVLVTTYKKVAVCV